jgi:hypothetical protein
MKCPFDISELQSPVEVAIALDLSVDQVRTIYREYWELDGMFSLRLALFFSLPSDLDLEGRFTYC